MEKYNNNKAIYHILCLIDHHYELGTNPDFINDPDLKKMDISEKRIKLILASLVDSGYITGIPVVSSLPEIKEPIGIVYPQLTIAGMNYLVENSTMKKALKLLDSLSGLV